MSEDTISDSKLEDDFEKDLDELDGDMIRRGILVVSYVQYLRTFR
jgi:hypothetical protein